MPPGNVGRPGLPWIPPGFMGKPPGLLGNFGGCGNPPGFIGNPPGLGGKLGGWKPPGGWGKPPGFMGNPPGRPGCAPIAALRFWIALISDWKLTLIEAVTSSPL